MTEIVTSLVASPSVWFWLGLGAVLLAVELPTATGWLLVPSICAFLMASIQLIGGTNLGWPGQLVIYALTTIVATLLARRFGARFFRGRTQTPDINDRTTALIGKTGLAVGDFVDGNGRVLVDGAEWNAEIEIGGSPAPGGKVEVVRVLGGSKLAVRPV